MSDTPAVLIGRRVSTVDQIDRPGDYCGPVRGFTGALLSVFYRLPNVADDSPEDHRRVHHVTSPPHVFRECADGSLEIRNSIGAFPYWHGWLDEGHKWRDA